MNIKYIRQQLAENGVEVTIEQTEELHKMAVQMKKLSKLSQWKLDEVCQKVSKEFGNDETAKILYNSLLEMK